LTAQLDHPVRCVEGNMVFLRKHHDWYTQAERDFLRTYFAGILARTYQKALAQHNTEVARTCRRMYLEVHPNPGQASRQFGKRAASA
jgi:hypothetical protein